MSADVLMARLLFPERSGDDRCMMAPSAAFSKRLLPQLRQGGVIAGRPGPGRGLRADPE